MADNNTLLEKLEGLVARFEEVSTLITDPNVIADQKRYVKLTKEYKDMSDIMKARKEYVQCINGLEGAKQIMTTESDILSQMLYILKDGHVNLSSAKRTSFYDEWYQGYDWNYREDILYQTYLGSASTGYYTSAGLKYKIFDNNIGYIRYESFSSGVGDGNLDEVLLYLATCNGLIIDVRDNGGGNLTNSTRIAARFTNEKTLTGYIQHKTGPGHNDFSKMEPIYLEPSNSIRWQKKVIILTNRRCYSATNDFVNAMRSLNKDNEEKRIIQLGDWTGGGSGLPFSSELPNGWSVRFSASPHFDKNKQPLEEGIEPDIAINMSESDQLKHKDTLIDKAFEILSE